MTSLFFDHKKIFSGVDAFSTHGAIEFTTANNFALIHHDRDVIEQQFNDLFASLSQNDAGRQKFWLICYLLGYKLKTYYKTYSPEQANVYQYKLKLIAKHLHSTLPITLKPVELALSEKIHRDLAAIASIPFSSAKLRQVLGNTNMQRLSTRFSLLTLQLFLLAASEYKLLSKKINVDILNTPMGVFNALSVGIFAARFVIHMTMLLKHVLNPVGLENELTMSERFYVELKKRHYHLVNDVVWGTVNALTNYAAYFHISAALAVTLTVGFLVFDAVWLGVALYLVELDYSVKIKQYLEYRNALTTNSAEWLMQDDMIKQFERSTENTRMTLRFYIAAALLLAAGFSAGIYVSPVFFLACNLAAAMYLSGHLFGAYKEKCLIVVQENANSNDLTKEQKAIMEDSWNNLAFAMAKNMVMPFILIGAYTLNVPAAIALTVAYAAYESKLDYFSDISLTKMLNNVGLWSNVSSKLTEDSLHQSLILAK